jgi:hypothetical protein
MTRHQTLKFFHDTTQTTLQINNKFILPTVPAGSREVTVVFNFTTERTVVAVTGEDG